VPRGAAGTARIGGELAGLSGAIGQKKGLTCGAHRSVTRERRGGAEQRHKPKEESIFG
jgi:hypothetical protein